MVAPSAFSKENSSPTQSGNLAPSESDKKAENCPIIAGVSLASGSSKIIKKLSKRGLIMNPVVLSILSRLPNRCMLKKSEKYVINGLDVPNLSSDKRTGKSGGSNQPKTTSHKRKLSSKWKRYAGLLLAILSSMMFSFTGLIVKILNHHHPLTQATWMFIATAICTLPLNLCRYLYEYKLNNRREDDDDDGSRQGRKTPESFKPFSDTIEIVKVIEDLGEQGDSVFQSDNVAENQSNVACEKLRMGLPPLTVVELMNNNDNNNNNNSTNKALLRRQTERRRQIKLFLLLVVRAFSGCSGMILYFYSLKYLNVGDSLVIVCSSPIFVFIIGYLFLGESCGVIPVFTIVLSMVGVAVITRPPMLTGTETFQTGDMIGAGLAFSSMLCIATTIILMRFLQNVYHGLINLVFGVWGSLQTAVLALSIGVLECPHDLQDGILMAATGVLFFLGQTFLAVSLQFEAAGPVSLVRTSEVVFAFVWQFIFLNVAPDWFSISGAGLILAGIFLTISRKWIAALPESSKSRRMLNFLLR